MGLAVAPLSDWAISTECALRSFAFLFDAVLPSLNTGFAWRVWMLARKPFLLLRSLSLFISATSPPQLLPLRSQRIRTVAEALHVVVVLKQL